MSKPSKELDYIISLCNNITNEMLFKKDPKSLYDPINYILATKGKNIRSILALISYKMLDYVSSEDVKNLILAIETFHNFTLIHDDLMDNALVRRGLDTINYKWSNNQAVLSGDVLLMESYGYLLNLKSPNRIKLIQSFNDTAIKICEGQQLDLDMQDSRVISLQDYYTMIDLKTSELIVFSLIAPWKLLSSEDKNIDIIKNIGYNLGRLFQIQDDYLDLYGDMKKTGKLVGGDVMEQKKTFLYTLALDQASLKIKDELIYIYHDSLPDKQSESYSNCFNNKLSKVLLIYDSIGIKMAVEFEINKLGQSTLDLISELNVNIDTKKILKEFITMILHRDL